MLKERDPMWMLEGEEIPKLGILDDWSVFDETMSRIVLGYIEREFEQRSILYELLTRDRATLTGDSFTVPIRTNRA